MKQTCFGLCPSIALSNSLAYFSGRRGAKGGGKEQDAIP